MSNMFRDRADAGRRLATMLHPLAGRHDVLVLGLARGGVPVAYEVARSLDAPLDAFVVRKLGVPGHEELAMGSIASGGIRHLNEQLIRELRISPAEIEQITAAEQRELERRERAYRGGRRAPDMKGRIIVLVDDGMATGASMLAAVTAVRRQEAASIVVAVPVATSQACRAMQRVADECACLETPWDFRGVGEWYGDFSQTSDAEVHHLLDEAAASHPVGATTRAGAGEMARKG